MLYQCIGPYYTSSNPDPTACSTYGTGCNFANIDTQAQCQGSYCYVDAPGTIEIPIKWAVGSYPKYVDLGLNLSTLSNCPTFMMFDLD